MIFEHLYGAFGRVNAVVMWFNKHELTILVGEELFDLLCALIAHHIYFYLVSFAFQKFELCFVCRKNSIVIKPGYWEAQDCVEFVVVYDEVTYIALKGHVGERPGEIVVHDSCALVCKRCKTKKKSYRAFVVFGNDQRAVLERSCLEHWFRDVIHPTVFVYNRGGV